MKKYSLVSFLLPGVVLSGCVRAHDSRAQDPLIQASIYAIANPQVGQYIIYSNTMFEARRAAGAALDCDDDPCLLQPGGVILLVERPSDHVQIGDVGP